MRLNTGRQGADDAFFVEHHILSTLRHDHIILGRCTEDGERMLVTQPTTACSTTTRAPPTPIASR